MYSGTSLYMYITVTIGPEVSGCNRERGGCFINKRGESIHLSHLGLKLGGCNNEVAAWSDRNTEVLLYTLCVIRHL